MYAFVDKWYWNEAGAVVQNLHFLSRLLQSEDIMFLKFLEKQVKKNIIKSVSFCKAWWTAVAPRAVNDLPSNKVIPSWKHLRGNASCLKTPPHSPRWSLWWWLKWISWADLWLFFSSCVLFVFAFRKRCLPIGLLEHGVYSNSSLSFSCSGFDTVLSHAAFRAPDSDIVSTPTLITFPLFRDFE